MDYLELPELVRDSCLRATFHPNAHMPNEIRHPKQSARGKQQHEVWFREKRLGGGGFGIVWLERSRDGRLRAVKELKTKGSALMGKEGYVRELEALAKFSQHKFVDFFIESYGWYKSSDSLFIAMEYCEQGDLKHHLADNGPMAEDHVQDVSWQLLQGLIFMHDNGFAHRDLKPANILVKSAPPADEWHVKICDLGLSRRVGGEVNTTTIKGTPGFTPPEIIVPTADQDPRKSDPFAGDMWCLGETIFNMSTCRASFGNSLISLMEYARGGLPFPKQALMDVEASDMAINFIELLMAARPYDRLTAKQADKHKWMTAASEAPSDMPSSLKPSTGRQEFLAPNHHLFGEGDQQTDLNTVTRLENMHPQANRVAYPHPRASSVSASDASAAWTVTEPVTSMPTIRRKSLVIETEPAETNKASGSMEGDKSREAYLKTMSKQLQARDEASHTFASQHTEEHLFDEVLPLPGPTILDRKTYNVQVLEEAGEHFVIDRDRIIVSRTMTSSEMARFAALSSWKRNHGFRPGQSSPNITAHSGGYNASNESGSPADKDTGLDRGVSETGATVLYNPRPRKNARDDKKTWNAILQRLNKAAVESHHPDPTGELEDDNESISGLTEAGAVASYDGYQSDDRFSFSFDRRPSFSPPSDTGAVTSHQPPPIYYTRDDPHAGRYSSERRDDSEKRSKRRTTGSKGTLGQLQNKLKDAGVLDYLRRRAKIKGRDGQ